MLMDAELPFSQACENNKQPILEVLSRHLQSPLRLLEIGGGTGQHAVHLAQALPSVQWQSTEVPSGVTTLNLRLRQAALPNLPLALPLDVTETTWQAGTVDAVFTANTLHIMGWPAVAAFFQGVGRHLAPHGLLLVYGPFKYHGEFTTDSNARFDGWLKQRDPVSGVRDFEAVDALAQQQGLALLEDNAMPANNQLLVWRRAG